MQVNNTTWISSLPGTTVFVVAKADALIGTQPLTISDVGDFGIVYQGSRWTIKHTGATATSTIAGDTQKFHLFTFIFNGTGATNQDKCKFRYDGVENKLTFSGNIATTSNANNRQLNYGWDGLSTYFKGYIAEAIVLRIAASPTTLSGIENYLKTKYTI